MYDVDSINDIDIVAVADKLGIEPKKKGARYKALCIWHNDHTPSMQVGGKRNMCHCYACGEGGNVIGTIMQYQGVDFITACKWADDNFPGEVRKDNNTPQKKNSMKKLEGLIRKRRNNQQEEPFMVYDMETFNWHINLKNSFCRCMAYVFGRAMTLEVARMYYLGDVDAPARYPDVMFPLIDRYGQLRDVKVQAYECDERSADFFHKRKTCYWLGGKQYPEETFNRECLFGEHLLARYPDKVVILVESPKNACVGAAAYPEYLWVATGNKTMLNRKVLEVLQGRNVIVYPDEDAYDEWAEKLEGMKDIAPFNIQHAPMASGKADIADWIIKASIPDPSP